MTVLEGIRVMETRYKGYRFRSRLEARWAVFFSNLGLRWEYEPEGFELGNGVRYLPDFRVFTPQGGSIWYEIKPASALHDDKFLAFRKAVENAIDDCGGPSVPVFRAALLSGDPMDHIGRDGGARGGSACLNSFRAAAEWISALVTPPPGLASAG